jgi:tRNA/tmRNA/rRNA uracil-C5-methylase (TrmA/RlmC/RlmD family)
LKKNIALNRAANYRIHEGPGEEWTPFILSKKMDVVIVDPPRRGLEPATLKQLREQPAGRIFYLSCNPSTLARDLRELAAAYEITSLRGYDFFPQTPHIEVLAGLKRK